MITVGLIAQDGLKQKLEESGDIKVVFDVSGAEARKYLDKFPCDVVVTELMMPGEDGFALLENYRNVKFIVASELKSEVFVIRALDLGAKYYLVKPLELPVLLQRISSVKGGEVGGDKMLRRKTVSEKSLDERISNIFVSVGIPAHIRGYQFLREGIKLAVENPPIAERFDTTPSKVERAIRHAIEVAWNRGKIENINSVFGVKVYNSSEKPTNGEFIALLADKMLLECAY